MADTTLYRVLGALGRGSFAPLLAEAVFADGYTRRVVLHRPGPPEAWPLVGVASPHLVTEEGRIVTPQGRFAVSPWVPGLDVDALLERGLPPRARAELLLQGIRGLRAAESAGVRHGALSGANLRLDPSGTVRLLGFRGQGDADRAELFELLRGDDEALPDALGALLASPPPSWEAAEERLVALLPSLPGAPLAEVAAAPGEVALHPHALAGAELREVPPPQPVPARVRVAATAATTLLLGLLAGWFLGNV